MSGMMGGGGGSGGGGGMMPLGKAGNNGQGMATESVMGMDIPDFMGNMQASMGKDDHGKNPFQDTVSAKGSNVSMGNQPSISSGLSDYFSNKLGELNSMGHDSDLETSLANNKDQVNKLGNGNFDDELNKRYPQNYGLKL